MSATDWSSDVCGVNKKDMQRSQANAAPAFVALAKGGSVPHLTSTSDVPQMAMFPEPAMRDLRGEGARRASTRSLCFHAASAHRAENAADAQSRTLHGGGDRCHLFTAQRKFRWQLTSRGTSPPVAGRLRPVNA